MNNKERLIKMFESVNKITLTKFKKNINEDNTFDVNSEEDIDNAIKNKDEMGDVVDGGLGSESKSTDFDKEQLKKGLKVEMEHTDDPVVALDIAFDHLMENPKYYGEDDDDPEEEAMNNAREDV